MLFNALKQQQMASIPRSATGERKAETKTVQAAPVPSQAPGIQAGSFTSPSRVRRPGSRAFAAV